MVGISSKPENKSPGPSFRFGNRLTLLPLRTYVPCTPVSHFRLASVSEAALGLGQIMPILLPVKGSEIYLSFLFSLLIPDNLQTSRLTFLQHHPRARRSVSIQYYTLQNLAKSTKIQKNIPHGSSFKGPNVSKSYANIARIITNCCLLLQSPAPSTAIPYARRNSLRLPQNAKRKKLDNYQKTPQTYLSQNAPRAQLFPNYIQTTNHCQ